MIRKILFFIYFICIVFLLPAQSPDSLINELKTINRALANLSCSTGKGRLISNRAMNVFLSNKAGSYLSETEDLTLYKNSVILNSAEGTIAVNHSLYTPKGIDDRVTSLMTIGAKANALDALESRLTGKQINNQFGFLLKQTWIGKGSTHFNACINESVEHTSQKMTMDVLRASILYTLNNEITSKSAQFEEALNKIDSVNDIPGYSIMDAKITARKKFYADLQDEYEYKFARLQSETLAQTFNYNVVANNWTSVSFYIPLINEKIAVAPSFTSNFAEQYAYPFNFTVSHTRLWDNSKFGRLFLTLSGELYWNNSRDGYNLNNVSFSNYKNLGGTDTIHAALMQTNEILVGNYQRFFTPLLKAKIIYLPPDWHFGLSFTIEQNFGSYHALNSTLGIPIVLINKNAEPSINFEFQVRFFDLNNTINTGNSFANKTSISINAGIPFSRIAY